MKLLSRRKFMAGASASAVSGMRAHVLVPSDVTFGLTPVFLDSDIKLLSDLETYLSNALHERVRLVKRRTYQEIVSMLISGDLDAAWICGYPFVRYREKLSLLATPLYQGEPLYSAYLIVRNDSEAKTFEDLRDHVHAFSDPDSNSGFLVTRHLLSGIGETPASYFRKSIYTFGHRNVIRAVASGLADSGSVDGYVWDVMQEIEPNLVNATRVIRTSEPMGFPPIACAASSRYDDISWKMSQALFSMKDDPLGLSILRTLRLEGFIPGEERLYEGIAKRYSEIRDLV